MTNKNYEAGRDWEYSIKKYFEKEGAIQVTRGAGSHGMDVVALFPHTIVMIEAKTTELWPPPLYEEERAKIEQMESGLSDKVSSAVLFLFAIQSVSHPNRQIYLSWNPLMRMWRRYFLKLHKDDYLDLAYVNWVSQIERKQP